MQQSHRNGAHIIDDLVQEVQHSLALLLQAAMQLPNARARAQVLKGQAVAAGQSRERGVPRAGLIEPLSNPGRAAEIICSPCCCTADAIADDKAWQ